MKRNSETFNNGSHERGFNATARLSKVSSRRNGARRATAAKRVPTRRGMFDWREARAVGIRLRSDIARQISDRVRRCEGRWSVRIFLLVTTVGTVLLSPPVVGQQPAVGKVGVAGVLQRSYAASKADLMSEADKMPQADYNLKPGAMPEVRTFGQLFGHVAAGQFGICAAVKGV